MHDGSEEEFVFEDDAGTSVLIPPTYRITVQIDYEEGEPVTKKFFFLKFSF